MALARSASGPGGLSINTSSANSLFGSTSTTPAAGGMFASTQASKPLFGAAPTTTAPSGGLFGSLGGQPTTTAQTTGGLFGSTIPASQPQAAGLFGSTTATSQPQTGVLLGSTQQGGGGLFGNTSQPAPSGGLFGSTTAASQPQQSSGPFGSIGSQPAQNQNQNTGGGLFGAQNQNKPATSLFGIGNNQSQQSQPQQSTMFASTQPQQPLGSGFNNQQQQSVPGVRIDISNIKSSTRINDLHDDLQKQLEHIDKVIQGQINYKNQCESMMPKHDEQLSNVPSDVEYCSRKLKGLEDLMEGDAGAVSVLRDHIKEDAEHAKLSFRAIDNLKLPPQYHNSGPWPTKASGGDNRSQGTSARDGQDIVGYFSLTADELAGKLTKYQKNITEIELHLRGVDASTAQQIHTYFSRTNGDTGAQSDEVQELAESLQDFERGILNVAGKVGSAREGVQSLQLGGFIGPTNGGISSTMRNNVY